MVIGTSSNNKAIREPTEGHMISSEHLALIGFANRLGSEIFHNEPSIADEGNVRKGAQLLMSLLSSKPNVVQFESDCSSSSDNYSSDLSSTNRRDSFTFTCPSLSLERSSTSEPYDDIVRSRCTFGASNTNADSGDDSSSEPSLVSASTPSPPPMVLFSRPLKVDNIDAFRLSSDAMSRNLLLSFQKAVEWRFQSWSHSLSSTLVRKESLLEKQNASEDEIKKLLKTSEARLLMKLYEVSKQIDMLQAQTSFRVLPQRVERDDGDAESPLKKRRINDDSSHDDGELQPETEYQYKVAHALTFEGVINLHTPAGYSEITLSVPGTIEGTFLSADSGVEELTGVLVELDTRILAAMFEKSSRIIVRSAVEQSLLQDNEAVTNEGTKAAVSSGGKQEGVLPAANRLALTSFASPTPANLSCVKTSTTAAVITPRYKSPVLTSQSREICGTKSGLVPIPDDFGEKRVLPPRRLSPQSRSPEMMNINFTPSTPLQTEIKRTPSLVSPPPSTHTALDFSAFDKEDKGPNLPVLVQVACAAMRES